MNKARWIWATAVTIAILTALGVGLWFGGGSTTREGWETMSRAAGITAALVLFVAVIAWATTSRSSASTRSPNPTGRSDAVNTLNGNISGSTVIQGRDIHVENTAPGQTANFQQQNLLYSDQQLARRSLTGWLHSLQLDFDELWSDLCHESEEHHKSARDKIERIPWEHRRLPKEVAETKYLWGKETRNVFNGISPIMSKAYNSGSLALTCNYHNSESIPSPIKDDKEARKSYHEHLGRFHESMGELEAFRRKIDLCLESQTLPRLPSQPLHTQRDL
ncbi:hypothetical protein [Nocardiopsis alba]|uniref:hypothetical protein n=1 Tax=Nocardiopsis alba TaxID=53437 RepID=UPI00131DCAF5|nr:hypothetical protein [Nocardiopsis alba]